MHSILCCERQPPMQMMQSTETVHRIFVKIAASCSVIEHSSQAPVADAPPVRETRLVSLPFRAFLCVCFSHLKRGPFLVPPTDVFKKDPHPAVHCHRGLSLLEELPSRGLFGFVRLVCFSIFLYACYFFQLAYV